jgi:glutaredoxin
MAAVAQVTLYTRPECHLCEEALATLERLRRRYPHEVRTINITTDPALLERYRHRIPVLVAGGHEYAAPLSPAMVEKALESAQ